MHKISDFWLKEICVWDCWSFLELRVGGSLLIIRREFIKKISEVFEVKSNIRFFIKIKGGCFKLMESDAASVSRWCERPKK